MQVCQPIARRVAHPVAWVVLLGPAIGLSALPNRVDAAPPATPSKATPSGRVPSGEPTTKPGHATKFVEDVSLGAKGVLRGRVIIASDKAPRTTVAGLHVSLLRGQHTVAVTATDAQGRFALQNLPSGLYQVVVAGPGGPSWRLYRVWTERTAPPQASDQMSVPIGSPIVLGQWSGPFPIVSLREAATWGAVVGGAIAAPVIYHNAQLDNQVPRSP